MRRHLLHPILFSLLLLGTAQKASALHAMTAREAPKADPRLLRALSRGGEEVRVLVGIKDGTPSARQLLLAPDPAGEPKRRVRRLAAQRRLAGELPEREFAPLHFYESFSLMSGRATRDAVARLANHPDVSWVTLDGKKKPLQAAPQAAQLLINSDQSNSLGVTGAGQTVAVIDTGVDYSVTALGGGGFPNAKVIAGFDTADEDGDPMDCDGHGTSVAAVAAGPTGVAPDTKIVALKVFASETSGGSCEEEAFDSDIIQGIDWVIVRKAELGVTAINLSLGGDFSDVGAGADLGYCDSRVPEYAEPFDAATAAGIVVVAAAGNDGHTGALSNPGCVSSAVSAGAVYSQSQAAQGWSDGGGGILCRDAPVTSDLVVCFSNSNSNLSLLAPGAFWNVVTKGGGADRFAGTSAAAPAVAGAVALVRQVHPTLSASAVVALLRETGKPVADSRNGIVTPRIDTLAATQLALGPFAHFEGAAVAIPDGFGNAIATVTVSGVARPIASVHAGVQIDHPNPQELRLTLTGPDGTSVLLHDRTGSAQHPINANYGKTDASARSLAPFQGRAANGTWTLTVEDTAPGTAGRIRSFSVTVVPGQPIEGIPANTSGIVLPIVAHTQGTKLFKSDVRLYNPGAAARTFSLYYVPAGQNGVFASKATRTVGAGRVLALNDVIASEYGFADSIGQMTIVSPGAGFLATSRAYTDSDDGSFGLFTAGFSALSGLAFGSGSATANGLVKNGQFHTNVGFTEVSGAPVTVRMDVLNGNGVLIASRTASTEPNTAALIVDIIADRGLGAISNFRVNYTVTSLTGRIVPFATYVDDVTGDAIFQPARHPQAPPEDIIVSQAAHVLGANDDFFKTNIHITNLEAKSVTVTVSLLPLLLTGTPNPPRVYTLAPGETLEKLDVLQNEFGLSNPSAAGLRIHPNAPARLAVSTRTFVEKLGGTFGYFIPGAPVTSALGAGSGIVTSIQLDQAPAASRAGFRANIGFAEVAGASALVRVTVKGGDTGAVLGTKSYSVGANQLFQIGLSDILGAQATAKNVYVQFSVEGGAGRILAYATSVDNKSGDAIYIPAQREP